MPVNVCIARCDDYSADSVAAAFDLVLEPLGGIDWVQPGMTVAIKTNLVSRMSPDTAAVTHPSLLAELTSRLTARGARVIVGDSPGGPYTAAWVHSVYNGTLMEAVVKAGGELNQDFGTEEVRFPEGVKAKSFTYTSWLSKADAIIDFAKLKTHGMAGMTCAVKNFFGTIPGTRKPEMHYMYPNTADFCSMLVDLALYNKPRLTLVDAVDCMEGNGPTQGTLRHMGALLAADTPFNADLVCAHLIGMDANDAPTVAESIRRGLCPSDWRELEIDGDPDVFALPDFEKLPISSKIDFTNKLPVVGALLRRGFGTGPKIDRSKCVGCGKCAEVCPAGAAHVEHGKAAIDAKKCIRCFCCQEFCPKGAVNVHRPLLARLLSR